MSQKEIKSSYKRKKRELHKKYKSERDELRESYIAEVGAEYESLGKRAPVNPPKRSTIEEIGNSVSHGMGALLAIVAFALMLKEAEASSEYVGAVMYFLGQLIMFTVSCLYHAFPYGSRVKRLFRRFDYSCIYLLIGATFAPILLCYVGGGFGIAFLICQWLIIAAGITLVAVFGPARLRFVHIPLYVVLGWCGVAFLPLMIRNGDYSFLGFILGGGVIYSVGIIPFAIKVRASHFIWHLFVLGGAVVQWLGIYLSIYHQ